MIFQYDASKEKCPLPLVNLRLMLKKMQKDDIYLLKLSDAGSREDIPKLLNKLGYCYKQSFIDHGIVELTIYS
ncbi:MAG: sulfurtransferase TusA family protein [Colwellia sp.]|nr:sulfurtransferase TusA family protein [Colwellia sp.]